MSRAGDPIFWIACILLALILLAGGSARPDAPALLALRPICLLVVGLLVALGRFPSAAVSRAPLVALALLAAVMLLQLVPLPPGLWSALPGHDRYADADVLTQTAPWRPINLVPDRGWAALFALGVPLAATLSVGALGRADRAWFCGFIAAAGCASALLALFQLLGPVDGPLYLYPMSNKGGAVGLFANRNHQAIFLAMTLPALRLWASATGVRRGSPNADMRGWLATAAGVFVIAMLLATGSRAGLAALAMALVGAATIVPMPEKVRLLPRHRRIMLASGMFLLFVAFVAVVLWQGRALSVDRLVDADLYEGELRFKFYPVIADMIARFMPFGTGIASFDPVFRGFEPDATLRPSYFNRAHSDVLELLLAAGVLGLGLLVGFVIWLVRAARALRHGNADGQALGRLGWLMLALISLGSLFDYPLGTPIMASIAALAALWIGDAVGARRPSVAFDAPRG